MEEKEDTEIIHPMNGEPRATMAAKSQLTVG
jgi:hypothetical protein